MHHNLEILCVLVTDTSEVLGRVVCMPMARDSYVSIFLTDFANAMSHLIPNHIRPSQLIPWRPHVYFPTDPNNLPGHVQQLHLDTQANRGATQLDDGSLLEDHFSDPLPRKHVHMVVQLPHVPVQSPAQFGLGTTGIAPFRAFATTSPYATESPSDAAHPSAFRVYQKDSVIRLLNDRPTKDIWVTPIALLWRPFGQFHDHIRNPPETMDVNMMRIGPLVDEFASLMCKHYDSEAQRRDKLIPVLNNIFSCSSPQSPSQRFDFPPIMPATISRDRRTDGHALGPGQTPDIIVEMKNEFGAGGTDPEIQLTSYYLQILAQHLISGSHNFLHECSLLPALGISIISKSSHRTNCLHLLHSSFQAHILGSAPLSLSAGPDSWRSRRCFQPDRHPVTIRPDLHFSKHSARLAFSGLICVRTCNNW